MAEPSIAMWVKKYSPLILEEGIDPVEYVEKNKLGMINDTSLISSTIQEVLSENPKALEEYKAGEQKSTWFFVGQIMRKLGGKANPQIINKLLTEALKEI